MKKRYINNYKTFNENSNIEYIYHGTSRGAALNIQRDGYIKPKNTGEVNPSISFTNDKDYGKYYANAKGGKHNSVLLRTILDAKFILSPRIKNNKGDEYITFDNLSSDLVEIYSPTDGWKPINSWNIIFNEPL